MIELHVDTTQLKQSIDTIGDVLPKSIEKAIKAASRDAMRHLGRLIKSDPDFPDIMKPKARIKRKGNQLWIGLNPVDILNFKKHAKAYTLKDGEFGIEHGGKTTTSRESSLERSSGEKNITIEGGKKRYIGVYKRKGKARLPIIKIKEDIEDPTMISVYNHLPEAEKHFIKRFNHHLNIYNKLLT